MSIVSREEIIGKKVIDGKGYEVGEVADIAISMDGIAILKVKKEDGSEVTIPMTRVQAIGQYVLLKPAEEWQAGYQAATQQYPPPPPSSSSPPPPPPPSQQSKSPLSFLKNVTQRAPPPPPSYSQTICPKCRAPNPPDAVFCQRCGARIR